MDAGLGGGSIPLLPVPGTSAPVPQFSFLSTGDPKFSRSREREQGTSLVLGGGGGEDQGTTFITASPGLLLPADTHHWAGLPHDG